VGQAELMGSVRPGDVVAEIDGAPVGEVSFDKVSRACEDAEVVRVGAA